MANIIIVDYHLGNLFSVKNACEKLGLNVEISNEPDKVLNADALILPGVGAFKEAMDNLEELELIEPIKKHIENEKPFLGICLGLQLLFSESVEFGEHKGLNVIEGRVEKIPEKGDSKMYVPQIGWNKVLPKEAASFGNSPLNHLKEDDFVYFVHSYYVKPTHSEVILTTTEYNGFEYCSSVLKNNIFACQFHPEKSGELGLKIYENWAGMFNLK